MSPDEARTLFLDQLGPNDTLARYGEKAAVAAIMAVVPTWQPIATAPRGDGVMRLLFEPHEEGGFMFIGCCERSHDEWFNNLDMKTQHPTHWMPLPNNSETPSVWEQPA